MAVMNLFYLSILLVERTTYLASLCLREQSPLTNIQLTANAMYMASGTLKKVFTRATHEATTDAWGQIVVPTTVIDPTNNLVISILASGDRYVWWRVTNGQIVVQVFTPANGAIPTANTQLSLFIYFL